MTEKLTFVTGNIHKAERVARLLNTPLFHTDLNIAEIQSVDLDKVIEHKAISAYRILNKPVLVDDTALYIHAWGRLPGPFIKWFETELGLEKICTLLIEEDRSANAQVNFAYYDGINLKITSGKSEGTIALKPAGNKGFGWDPIFIPNGYTQTRAEMEMELQEQTSPRTEAIKEMEEYLKNK